MAQNDDDDNDPSASDVAAYLENDASTIEDESTNSTLANYYFLY